MADGFFDNPFTEALEETPEAAFFSSPRGQEFAAGSPVKGRFFENQFARTMQDFLRKQGEALRAGELPTQTFQETVDETDFETIFRSLPPNLRGFFQRQVAPQTRFLVNF